jgi:hypothetical protein
LNGVNALLHTSITPDVDELDDISRKSPGLPTVFSDFTKKNSYVICKGICKMRIVIIGVRAK